MAKKKTKEIKELRADLIERRKVLLAELEAIDAVLRALENA